MVPFDSSPSRHGQARSATLASRPHVLLVEDDQATAWIIARTLRQAGYDVTMACDGADGLESALMLRPDVIVTDVTMPRLDGISMIRNIRQVDSLRQIPIVVLTSLGRPSEVADGINAGARSYLMKPVCLGDLESTLQRLVQRSKSLRPAPGHDSG
jgi:two-component system, OmpR family, response regulator MprA